MKKLGAYIQNIFLVLIILLLVALATVYLLVKESMPIYHGEIRTERVQDSVKVIFGPYGVPHIYANNDADAYFSLGYIHAQERLFQMEILRRISAGRLSEIFGAEMIQTDRLFRALNINAHSEKLAIKFNDAADSHMKICVNAFLEGINEYISRDSRPPEFKLLNFYPEPFTVKDIYLIAGYMAFSFTEAVRTDPLLSLIKYDLGSKYLMPFGIDSIESTTPSPIQEIDSINNKSVQKLALITENLPIGIWSGSNAIVIGPSRSSSGHVLFENDTHIGFQQPSVWYEAHIHTPTFEVYGNYLAGISFPLIGHNRV